MQSDAQLEQLRKAIEKSRKLNEQPHLLTTELDVILAGSKESKKTQRPRRQAVPLVCIDHAAFVVDCTARPIQTPDRSRALRL